uniref:Bestrophin homolog n=1 Tax=Panagrellus redivivus TaxID=6233 RepID=A0A7E4V803_PANRE
MALAISTYLKSDTATEPHVQVIRKTCAGYIMLSFILVMRDVSSPIRIRFPQLRMLVENGGLLTETELTMLEGSLSNFPGACKYWIPIIWMCNLLKKHYGELTAIDRGNVVNRYAYNDLINEVSLFQN